MCEKNIRDIILKILKVWPKSEIKHFNFRDQIIDHYSFMDYFVILFILGINLIIYYNFRN